MKCINCGGADHITRACQKPELPKEKRPCWKCGKPGHLGRDCRSSGLVDDETADMADYFGCVTCEGEFMDGFSKAKKTFKPVPPRSRWATS